MLRHYNPADPVGQAGSARPLLFVLSCVSECGIWASLTGWWPPLFMLARELFGDNNPISSYIGGPPSISRAGAAVWITAPAERRQAYLRRGVDDYLILQSVKRVTVNTLRHSPPPISTTLKTLTVIARHHLDPLVRALRWRWSGKVLTFVLRNL
jgi:hypothetical protein